MKFTKKEASWIAYDCANSVYATIMVAAIFPIYFAGVCGGDGDYWWGIGTSAATAAMAVLAPIVGVAADYRGWKKKLLAAFLAIGLAGVALCAALDDWRLLLLAYAFSHVGFSGSCLVYDSFITDVTTPERMDRVSSYGFAFGYIGGSTVPFVASILLIMLGPRVGIGSAAAVKLSVCLTVLWWGAFSVPILKNVRQEYGQDAPERGIARHAFGSLAATVRGIARDKGLMLFIVAYFFYIDGVSSIINMATAYGATLSLDSTKMILALLLTQVVAFPCAILFGRLAARAGSLRMILRAIALYFAISLIGFFMGFGLEEGFLATGQAEALFWLLAALVGTVQGGIQAISRSYYGKLVPPDRSGEYFGFYDIFGKFAAVLGPLLYALTKRATGRSSLSVLSIALLFVAGFALLLAAKARMAAGGEKNPAGGENGG